VRRFWKDVKRGGIDTISSNSSIDRSLEGFLHVPGLSGTLSRAFAQLPADCKIIFVYPYADDKLDFVGLAIGYLTWPRTVEKVGVQSGETFSGKVSEKVALVFYQLPPPFPGESRQALAPNLVLVEPPKR